MELLGSSELHASMLSITLPSNVSVNIQNAQNVQLLRYDRRQLRPKL